MTTEMNILYNIVNKGIEIQSIDKDIKIKKLIGIDNFIIRAKQEFTKNIEKEFYGKANEKEGFLDGLIEGRKYLTSMWFSDIDNSIEWVLMRLEMERKNKNWGKCEYWQCYISGLNVCKSIIGK